MIFWFHQSLDRSIDRDPDLSITGQIFEYEEIYEVTEMTFMLRQ